MKRITSIIVSILMIASCCSIVALADEGVKVTINGIERIYDRPPVIINDRVLVPMRGIFNDLGADVTWNEETKSISVGRNAERMTVYVDKDEALVNGVMMKLDTPATIIGDRTFVPIRFVAESLAAEVKWVESTKTVEIVGGMLGKESMSEEVDEALAELETRYDEKLIDWMVSMYDPSGGFYYAASGRDTETFAPDIESTCQGYGRLMGYLGFNDFSSLPQDLKDRTIKFLQERQNPEDGYFYDPQFGTEVGLAKAERNTSYAADMLAGLGAKPLYKLPSERVQEELAKKENNTGGETEENPGENSEGKTDEATQSSELSSMKGTIYESEETVLAWLDSLPFESNSYYACHMVSSSSEMLNTCGYAKLVADYLREKQNTETGFWGGGLNYTTLSAAMKASPCFKPRFTGSGSFPNAEKMAQSLVYVVKNCVPDHIANLCNPAYTMVYANDSFVGGFPKEIQDIIYPNLADMVRAIALQLDTFRQPDGGYGYLRTGSIAISQGALVSLAHAEGDVNAFALASDIRTCLYRINGRRAGGIANVDPEDVWERLRNAKAPVKQPLVLGCNEDFNECVSGKLPEDEMWTFNPDGGKVEVTEDPDKSRNKVLELTTVSGGYSSIGATFDMTEGFDVLTFECKMRFQDCRTEELFYNQIGATALSICSVLKPNNKIALCHRTSGAGYGEEFVELDQDTWYKFKIEYSPKDDVSTVVRYYIDDELVLETGKYVNDDIPGRYPKTEVKTFSFNAFGSARGTLLLDDIKMYRD